MSGPTQFKDQDTQNRSLNNPNLESINPNRHGEEIATFTVVPKKRLNSSLRRLTNLNSNDTVVSRRESKKNSISIEEIFRCFFI